MLLAFIIGKMEDRMMKIKEINFDIMESVRKKCITFAKDGNTVVKPYRTLYSLENIMHNTTYKNLYLEVVKGKEWQETHYQIWDDLQVICISQGWVQGFFDISEFSEKILEYPYLGINGFYKKLEEAERNGYYINKVEIEVCTLLGNIDLVKHYLEYRERQIAEKEAKRQAEAAERERKGKEEEEKRLAEIEKTISDTEYKIFHQEDFNNLEVDGKSVINKLMGKYGIKVPLRTQGWINSKLAMIVFKNGEISYRFYGKSQRNNSTVFRKYLVELKDAIDLELALPFC